MLTIVTHSKLYIVKDTLQTSPLKEIITELKSALECIKYKYVIFSRVETHYLL